jgi:hypothetical protein
LPEKFAFGCRISGHEEHRGKIAKAPAPLGDRPHGVPLVGTESKFKPAARPADRERKGR